MTQSLDKDLRSALEKTVKAARSVAETAAHAALDQLGVGHDKPEAFLSEAEKALRNRLRTHGKQVGDVRDSKSSNPTYGNQEVQHLVQEVAYQHWHRMLFARFLADNNLLMFDNVAVTIEECGELAPDEGAKSGWELAGKLAARMLPQVFKPGSPVFELNFAPEHQSELERLLKALPETVFKASDSLGWVYQFWQADNKERINKSEVRIGADELPAVTQLFTEPYMVAFLLHNSLGAWWATRYPGKPCPVNLDYFRTLEEGTPAAGNFDGWPDSLADFKLLDPCCGSGHFLVAAFLMLVPMRMAAESLGAKEAVNRVLAENIHGLELDPRCVEIAVFAVALEAWRYPDASGKPLGVREMPKPNIACCGLKVVAKVEDWEALVPSEVPNSEHLREGLSRLHELFVQAPLLGSLLAPSKQKSDLFGADYRELGELLQVALARESPRKGIENEERWDSALSALGLLGAASILNGRYHLVITNVPYLGRGRQNDSLRAWSEEHYPHGMHELATCMMARCIELTVHNGLASVVVPQSWLFAPRYKNFRKNLLNSTTWVSLARLGAGAFETISGEVVNVVLATFKNTRPIPSTSFFEVDCQGIDRPSDKALALRSLSLVMHNQLSQLNNPDFRIRSVSQSGVALLAKEATSVSGLKTGDVNRFNRKFWEIGFLGNDWSFIQQSVAKSSLFGGLDEIIFWQSGKGELRDIAESVKHLNHVAQNWRRGQDVWGKKGIAISAMGGISCTLYNGNLFDSNVTVVAPNDPEKLGAIWAYCTSPYFSEEIRLIDKKLSVTTATLLKVPFDEAHWAQVTSEEYPRGLPKPYSDDPTHWIFYGNPRPSTDPLQVAVSRLVGYVWPTEYDNKMELSDETLQWIAQSRELAPHSDKDGIVCIPPVGREASASDRLLNLLADSFGTDWSNDVLGQLLAAADHAGKSLETWLRDKFFTQHCAVFGNRPFVWHVWDGLRDGFAALVNYHKLDYKTLEALIYTYLGDWIGRQKRDADSGVDGAQEKLAAAEGLKKRLELILAGEAPYDIFVRWKPIQEQPIGWSPDLNDGVRMNIRPFLSVPDVGKRGAGVLRDKPNIKWEKDRGSDVVSAPWYELGLHYGGKVGDRINDHHLSLSDKLKARENSK